jgi:hypothetical protein
MRTWFRVNAPAVVFDASADDTVIINLVSGRYFRLDASSSLAWNALVASGSRGAFSSSATNESDVLASMDDMIARLVTEELIVETPVDAADANPEPWTFAGFTLESFSDLEDILGLDPIHEVDPNKGWPTARA